MFNMISVIILQAKYYFDVLGKEYMNLNSFFFVFFSCPFAMTQKDQLNEVV